MGDRTNCSLALGGTLFLDGLVAPLATVLDEAEAIPAEVSSVADELRLSDPTFLFEEINYGEMDAVLRTFLEALRLSYAWRWDAGGGYGEGISLFCGTTRQSVSFGTLEREIVLPVQDLDDPARVSSAKAWHQMDTTLRMQVLSSSHARLSAAADAPQAAILEAQQEILEAWPDRPWW